MDMGRVVRWSRKLSVNKVAWFLRSWYVEVRSDSVHLKYLCLEILERSDNPI